MKISFDFDGTLTIPRIRTLFNILASGQDSEWLQSKEMFIITNRDEAGNNNDLIAMLPALGDPPVHYCNHLGKSNKINKLGIEMHFDDDLFECQEIEELTNCKCVMVDFSWCKPEKTEAGIIHI